MVRSDLVRGPEMDFCHLSRASAPFVATISCAVFFTSAETPRPSLHSQRVAPFLQPVNKRFPRQDRGRRNREIRFGLGPLLQSELFGHVEAANFQ